MEAKLIVVGGKANMAEVKLKLPALVGRGRDADLTVAHSTVSRRHCILEELDGALVVRDVGSLNGTVVEGNRITRAVVKPGETLTIGPLTFKAQYKHTGTFPTLGDKPTVDVGAQLEDTVADAAGPALAEVPLNVAPAELDDLDLQLDEGDLDEFKPDQGAPALEEKPAIEPAAADDKLLKDDLLNDEPLDLGDDWELQPAAPDQSDFDLMLDDSVAPSKNGPAPSPPRGTPSKSAAAQPAAAKAAAQPPRQKTAAAKPAAPKPAAAKPSAPKTAAAKPAPGRPAPKPAAAKPVSADPASDPLDLDDQVLEFMIDEPAPTNAGANRPAKGAAKQEAKSSPKSAKPSTNDDDFFESLGLNE